MKCLACLPVDSVGTCARCGYHGPGPGHLCPASHPDEFCERHMPKISSTCLVHEDCIQYPMLGAECRRRSSVIRSGDSKQ